MPSTTTKETKHWWQWRKREKPQELMQGVKHEVDQGEIHDPNTDVVINHFTMWYDRIATEIYQERTAAGLQTDKPAINDNGKSIVQGRAAMDECKKKYPEDCEQLAWCLWDAAVRHLRLEHNRFAYVRKVENKMNSKITIRPFLPEWPNFQVHYFNIGEARGSTFPKVVNRETESYLNKVQMVLDHLIYCPLCAEFDYQIVRNVMQRVRDKANEIMEASTSKTYITKSERDRWETELRETTFIFLEDGMVDATKFYDPMAHEGLWWNNNQQTPSANVVSDIAN